MLKDKNLEKAMLLVSQDETDYAKLSVEDVMRLQLEAEVAERAYDEQFRLVKKHHNEVYAPMCEKKTELEVKMHLVRLKLAKAQAMSPAMAKLIKVAKKLAK